MGGDKMTPMEQYLREVDQQRRLDALVQYSCCFLLCTVGVGLLVLSIAAACRLAFGQLP